MNITTQKWKLKLKRNDFQTYPRKETVASGGKRCRKYSFGDNGIKITEKTVDEDPAG